MTVLTSNKEVEEFDKNPPEEIDNNLYVITDIKDNVYVVNGAQGIPQSAVAAVRSKVGDNDEKLRIKSLFSSKFGKQDPEVFNQKVHDDEPESKAPGDGSLYDRAADAIKGGSEEGRGSDSTNKVDEDEGKNSAEGLDSPNKEDYKESLSIRDILKL